jgi:hypothetical protein
MDDKPTARPSTTDLIRRALAAGKRRRIAL